ncbi:hypothetical protein OPV22_022981 [Ensete ventricosum]|uniref:PDZ domain-containing protein n=1 Tax=Ensete ventricosum TaxID=4639 RepID=A0AAV8QGV0_ENSVE|nr:hypothetical protein OPV22_022981 [Ensete ventricosum]
MGGNGTVVGVKRVEAGMPSEEWDDSMPLPGDIVKGVAPADDDDEEEEESPIFASAKTRSEISSVLGRLGRRSDSVWVKVQRGNNLLDLRARVVPYRGRKLYRCFTVMAARDDRHVAVLGDLTLEQCTELQEMSRTVVSMDGSGFVRKKSVSYDWKKKVGTYLPHSHSTLVSSILFMPFPSERNFEATTTRSMAWFSSAVSSGTPLVFVNIQTEQIQKAASSDGGNCQSSWKEMSWLKQQGPKHASTVELLQAIRLWFLPGIVEVPLVLAPEEGERRFGMDIKRTEEGFICISSVFKGSAADRAGLRNLCGDASKTGHLVIISRLQGKGVLPSEASSDGRIVCCDHTSIKERLAAAIEETEEVRLHIMRWPDQRPSSTIVGPPAILLPPAEIDGSTLGHKLGPKSSHLTM